MPVGRSKTHSHAQHATSTPPAHQQASTPPASQHYQHASSTRRGSDGSQVQSKFEAVREWSQQMTALAGWCAGGLDDQRAGGMVDWCGGLPRAWKHRLARAVQYWLRGRIPFVGYMSAGHEERPLYLGPHRHWRNTTARRAGVKNNFGGAAVTDDGGAGGNSKRVPL